MGRETRWEGRWGAGNGQRMKEKQDRDRKQGPGQQLERLKRVPPGIHRQPLGPF